MVDQLGEQIDDEADDEEPLDLGHLVDKGFPLPHFVDWEIYERPRTVEVLVVLEPDDIFVVAVEIFQVPRVREQLHEDGDAVEELEDDLGQQVALGVDDAEPLAGAPLVEPSPLPGFVVSQLIIVMGLLVAVGEVLGEVALALAALHAALVVPLDDGVVDAGLFENHGVLAVIVRGGLVSGGVAHPIALQDVLGIFGVAPHSAAGCLVVEIAPLQLVGGGGSGWLLGGVSELGDVDQMLRIGGTREVCPRLLHALLYFVVANGLAYNAHPRGLCVRSGSECLRGGILVVTY